MNKEPDKTPWHQKTWAQLLLIISAVVTGVVTLLAWLKIDPDTVSPILRRVVSSLEPYKIYLGAFFLLLVGVWQRDRLWRWYHQAGQLLRSIYIRMLARILRPVFTESSSTIHYGCRVRFRHFTTGKYLTSLAGLFYTHQGGSTQQIVFGASIPDENSIWILQSPHGSNPDFRLNQDIKFGDVVRIYHEVSGQYLHSHSARSPCSPPPPAPDFQREVTVSFQHNAHDNWTIRSLAKLLTGAKLRFEHADGGQFLHSHDRLYGVNGRSNSFEVTCCCDDNEDGSWILSNASSGPNGGLITTGDLIIHHASYGRDGKSFDLTDLVRGKVRNDSLEIVAGNHLAGDPNPGNGKSLTVDYSIRGVRAQKIAVEDQTIKIP